MSLRNTSEPDTIVEFFQHEYENNREGLNSEFKENSDDIKNCGTHSGCLLHLRESLQGNIFNRSFQYIWLRNIFTEDKKENEFKAMSCGNLRKDYFVTLEKRECLMKFIDNSWQKNNRLDDEKRFVILAYKTLDERHCLTLERNWKDWTGTSKLVNELSKMYQIAKIWFLKAASNVHGSFRYIVFIELMMNNKQNQSDNYALDCLQKFRIKRMSGYVALYVPIN